MGRYNQRGPAIAAKAFAGQTFRPTDPALHLRPPLAETAVARVVITRRQAPSTVREDSPLRKYP